MTDQSPVPTELPPPAPTTAAPVNPAPQLGPDGLPLAPSAPAAPRRRRTLAIVITVVVVVVVASVTAAIVLSVLRASGTGSAYRFTSSAFPYAVSLPGKPTVTEGKGSDGGATEQLQWLHGSVTVTVEAEVLPVTVTSDHLQAVLNDALSGGAKAMGGTNPRDQTTYTLDGVRAQSEVVDVAAVGAGGTVYEAAAIKDKVVYIIVITNPTADLEKSVNSTFTFTH